MIQTITTSSFGGVRREASITCDVCGAHTPTVDIGPATTGSSAALAAIRLAHGFVESTARVDMTRVGDTAVRDLCERCVAKEPS